MSETVRCETRATADRNRPPATSTTRAHNQCLNGPGNPSILTHDAAPHPEPRAEPLASSLAKAADKVPVRDLAPILVTGRDRPSTRQGIDVQRGSFLPSGEPRLSCRSQGARKPAPTGLCGFPPSARRVRLTKGSVTAAVQFFFDVEGVVAVDADVVDEGRGKWAAACSSRGRPSAWRASRASWR